MGVGVGVGVDVGVHVDVSVRVDVDVVIDGDGDGDVYDKSNNATDGPNHRHIFVNIATSRVSNSIPRSYATSSTTASARNVSSTAAHSIADPRAIA